MKRSMEAAVESNGWFADGNKLIVVPQGFSRAKPIDVLFRNKAHPLERAPQPAELIKFRSVICLETGEPKKGEDLRRRSLWRSNGVVSSLGVIFPDLKDSITGSETLQGILYPDTVTLRKESIEDNPQASLNSWIRALKPLEVVSLTYLLSENRQAQILEALLEPPKRTFRLGIWGLGDIGTIVASSLRASDIKDSHISDLFIGGSRDARKINYQVLELEDLNIEGLHQPLVHPVLPGQEELYFRECDLILVLIASDITSPQKNQTSAIDVRSEQYARNLAIVAEFIEKARSVDYNGQILVASDPVEQLTMGMYRVMKQAGIDVNTHQFVGFGSMVNRSRAKFQAEEMGSTRFRDEGALFGPHGKMVAAMFTHHPDRYNPRQAEELSIRTGYRNYVARENNAKPHIAPAFLIAQGITRYTAGNSLYASPFLPSSQEKHLGVYFGTRVQADRDLGVVTPDVNQPFLPVIMGVLNRIHAWVETTSYFPEALKIDPYEGILLLRDPQLGIDLPVRHPAFHPSDMRGWFEKVESALN